MKNYSIAFLILVSGLISACSGSTKLIKASGGSAGNVIPASPSAPSSPTPPPSGSPVPPPNSTGQTPNPGPGDTPAGRNGTSGFRITKQPDPTLVCYNAKVPATFTVEQTDGQPTITFQWFIIQNGVAANLTTAKAEPGLKVICPRNSYTYHVEVRDSRSLVITSDDVQMTVLPSNDSRCAGVAQCP